VGLFFVPRFFQIFIKFFERPVIFAWGVGAVYLYSVDTSDFFKLDLRLRNSVHT
jgi:hypothetical protein